MLFQICFWWCSKTHRFVLMLKNTDPDVKTYALSIIDTMSVRVSGSRLTSESYPDHETSCSTLVSAARWDSVYLKTKKCKGNRTRNFHIISNSFSTPSSTNWWICLLKDSWLHHLWTWSHRWLHKTHQTQSLMDWGLNSLLVHWVSLVDSCQVSEDH
jgi:hypothetical protein